MPQFALAHLVQMRAAIRDPGQFSLADRAREYL